MGAPRPRLTLARMSASRKLVVASTMALARRAGSSLLKMPEPTNTASAPSCMTRAASAGVAMPPAQNIGHRQRAGLGDLLHERQRGLQLLGPVEQLGRVGLGDLADVAEDRAQVADGLDDVAGAGLALGADHAGALGDAPQRLAEVGGAAHERDGEGPLVDVVGLVGGGEHLGLVDVVDAEGLEDLGLDEVADAGLGHDRDGDDGLDALDHLGIAHPGDAAVATDVGGHALERHDGDGAGVLGDLGLLGVDDVHDDAALQHLGQASLDELGARLTRHEPFGELISHGVECTGGGARLTKRDGGPAGDAGRAHRRRRASTRSSSDGRGRHAGHRHPGVGHPEVGRLGDRRTDGGADPLQPLAGR